jgi:deoxyhypusine synthase
VRAQTRCAVFLGYTSNLISSGLREVILHLVKHRHVSCLVTTAGGVEEDFIKCLGRTYLAAFDLDGADLRRRGMNRIGNLVVPNDNYCKFEDWLTPILDSMVEEQRTQGAKWTPSAFIRRLGKEINNEESVYYWAYKNDIPVFCPALTDGSIGDMIYFHSFKNPGLVLDIVEDIRALNEHARTSPKAGMIILGGGVCKHQIANAMLIVRPLHFCDILSRAYPASRSATEPTFPYTSTRARSLTAPTRVRAQTRPCRGARSGRAPRASRCLRTRRSCSPCSSRRRSHRMFRERTLCRATACALER